MQEGHLVMSVKERLRKSVLEQVARGEISLACASAQLGLTYRHTRRVMRRYRQEGDAGLVNRSRGRVSARRRPESFREKVLGVYRDTLTGMGPTLAAEKLAQWGLAVDHETLRRWLVADGQWQRRRKRGRHRQRRERKAHFGEMVQFDGSHHAWFGPEHPRCCLMNLVDDATGISQGWMDGQETTEAAMRSVWRWVERYGIPASLYVDRKNVYVTDRPPTPEEQLAGQTPLTAFGVACQKLGIALITAHSPQAKGRVERKHAVYQDRLVHELRLSNIKTIDGANTVIDDDFDAHVNQLFAYEPRNPNDAHRPVPPDLDLRDVFCFDETRTVAKDWTVSHHGQTYQILRLNSPLPKPGQKLIVRTWLDASIHLICRSHPLVFNILPEPAPRLRDAPAKKIKSPRGSKTKYKPACDHPWRRAAAPRR